jgi:hypothetical protein
MEISVAIARSILNMWRPDRLTSRIVRQCAVRKLIAIKLGLLALLGFTSFTTSCLGQGILWERLNLGVAEFGITSVDGGGATVQSPSVFEAGYNGAYIFGTQPFWGFAQSFSVLSERTLASIQLRLGTLNLSAQGQFALSVYEFAPLTQTPSALLGSVTADAAGYQYDLINVPISSFDFSGLNIPLHASSTYAWALTPASPSWSGSLSIQSATASLYPGGFAYAMNPTPEPATPLLLLLAAAILWLRRKKCGYCP